ncbi:MAG: glycoside hydrolase family 88 protein [Dysgonamonadaceae bacterium]|jgi:rhamnogalacturonyl hydrolase YesR|nr:glycoside hydrolase family 88 protein [Dysgonamonadaceae bacterium]
MITLNYRKILSTLILTGILFYPGKFVVHAENTYLAAVESSLRKAADWQIKNFKYARTGNLHDYGIDAWTNATLYIGMLEWAKIANDSTYYDWLLDIGNTNKWKLPNNFLNYPKYQFYHADELCIGQFYLSMFSIYNRKEMLYHSKERADWIINNPPDSIMNISNKQSWTWCDALFMAPPLYAHLAKIENDHRYIQFMDKEFKRTYNFLYDMENNLFFRDNSYINKKELNGRKIFWGRGNGWVAAGLVNILKALPEDSDYRQFYEKLFKVFIPRLTELQSSNGFWHASLLNPENYPSPETSATALITYALAYGINNGLLEKEIYAPAMEKSWNALLSIMDADGKIGWVQPIGADPKKVTENMTAPYGVGAFLLAGSEIYVYYNNF